MYELSVSKRQHYWTTQQMIFLFLNVNITELDKRIDRVYSQTGP